MRGKMQNKKPEIFVSSKFKQIKLLFSKTVQKERKPESREHQRSA